MRKSKTAPWLTKISLRAWLRSIAAGLVLIPLVGMLVASFIISAWSHKHNALDNATRGALHLERVNSLVNATVMNSRGIFMSNSEKKAEVFANKLYKDVEKLQISSIQWTQAALASNKTNAGELSKRIEQFITFRTELVSVFRDRGISGAREFADLDSARAEQAALNESLEDLSRAYEQDIIRLHADIASHEQWLVVLFSVTGATVMLIFIGTVALMRRGFLVPLFKMRHQMLALSQDNIEVPISGTERMDEIGEMARAVAVFQANLLERRKLNREAKLIAQLNEWLQSSKSLEELYRMVEDFMMRILPGCAGSLYVYSNSRDVLESARTWNGRSASPTIHPDDCWALRRGRTYSFGDEEIDFKCSHVPEEGCTHYLCIPILAHGETIGLLHLNLPDDDASPSQKADRRRLSIVCAEQISLAVANVKLRDQLRDQSIRDILTGLYNRRYMLESGRREFSRAARLRQPVSILSLEVDHFKTFNDNHGHDAGDIVLRSVGECLQTSFRDDDVACRFGGEEFVVILPGASMDDAIRRAEEVRARVEALVVNYMGSTLPRITVSIGVAAYPAAGETLQAVISAADGALYTAKDAGRNCVRGACAKTQQRIAPGRDGNAARNRAEDVCCSPANQPQHTTASHGELPRSSIIAGSGIIADSTPTNQPQRSDVPPHAGTARSPDTRVGPVLMRSNDSVTPVAQVTAPSRPDVKRVPRKQRQAV